MDLSRRTIFAGAAATGAALAASPALARTRAPAAPPLIGPAPGVAQLSLNENPYGPAPSALRAITDTAKSSSYYAGQGGRRLMAMIAEKNGVTPEHVVLSSGSGEVLNAAAMHFGKTGTLLGAELFWDAYYRYAAMNGLKVQRVPLLPTMYQDLAATEAAIVPGVSMVAVCNPNNPTGLMEEKGALHGFVKRASEKTFVLVDEAYNELSEDPDANSVMDLIREGRNVGVARTFSKVYGMAGLRVGYMILKPELAAKVRDQVMSSMNVLGLAAAVASYNDDAFIQMSRARIREGREMVQDAAKRLGLKYLPSQTNFVWIDVGQDANAVRDRFATRNIMIRGSYGKWTNWSRVSMGKVEDVQRYVRALPEVLRA
jgi:histidinol-phosphate aminotransferase